MTDTTKAQILDLARKAINTELLALKRMKETLGDNFADAVEMILSGQGKCIVTGMGKSGLVGRKIAATLASTGTPSFFLHPGEAFHGDLGMISKEDVVLALSYSGETDEILKIVAPDCSATDMIHAISKGGLGLIIICDGDRIEGIVTDGDVRRAMERRRAEFFNIKAADIATPNPKTISADRKLIEAEKMMTRNKVTSLLVTDEAGKLQGVIQIYDIKL